MLRICQGYAGEYDMLFNASKSKSILSAVQNLVIILIDIVLRLTLSYVAVLLRWLTVGHMLIMSLAKTDDKRDIGLMNGRTRFISRVNNIICVFCKLDCVTKMRLLKAYCSSFYGSELWDLADSMATLG